ncbi:MAG TPA: PBP1A family penicillin-binding protein [Stellaceae bacterium]|nr:PBP1A family penicillin-binding protein [Stellaceae bacterium]
MGGECGRTEADRAQRDPGSACPPQGADGALAARLMLGVLRGIARVAFIAIILVAVALGSFVGLTLAHFGRDLPDYQQLVDYVPETGSKVYAADGSQIGEFESEHRIPVAIAKVPPIVIRAFLAAEDHDFYSHRGVDPAAILRAALSDVLRLQRGQRPIGASTITQQVVRHFLLTNEVSIARKIKEAMLAYRIERTLSKDRILEIYLNEIYLGAGAYGVAAAADTYFQKPLDQLSLAEAALLAALPKAPNNYNPLRHPKAAQARRDWVLSSMAELGWISAAQASAATAEKLGVELRAAAKPEPEHTGYFSEEVRRELIGRFGEKAVYGGGLRVRTSYSAAYQQMAETAFRRGLVEYDRRHGWRGPVAHYATGAAAQAALAGLAEPPGPADWQLAAVTGVDYAGATIALRTGGIGHLALAELRWARRTEPDQRLGGPVRSVRDVLVPGDIVLVEPVAAAAPSRYRRRAAPASYALRQIPDASGGFVAMDPKTGRVLALVGGWSYRQSQFDRATQAMRQPGSAFKPFVYVTALENGFSPSSSVEDSPISLPQGPGLPEWQPANYEGSYVGETTLEDALVHSRNLATVHVAMTIGLPAIARTVQNFDVMDKMPLYYSMTLGAGDTTLLRVTSAYAMLDNGGHWLLPSVIDLVRDRNGRVIYQKGVAGCAACFVAASARGAEAGGLYRASGRPDPAAVAVPNAAFADNAVLYKPTKPDPLVSPDADNEIISMMQGVVQRGTGIEVSAVGKPLAGKTGTTSGWTDAWFVGFSPGLVAGVYVGFDEPRTLGSGEVGGHVAAPIFRDFMLAALKDQPATPFAVPAGAYSAVASAQSDATDDDDDAASSQQDNPGRDDDGAASDQDQAHNRGAAAPDARDADRASPDYPAALPRWPGNAAARQPAYAARAPYYGAYGAPGGPYYPAPAYPAPAYGAPAYGATQPPGGGYGYPSYPPAPGWAGRPRAGTGGLY